MASDKGDQKRSLKEMTFRLGPEGPEASANWAGWAEGPQLRDGEGRTNGGGAAGKWGPAIEPRDEGSLDLRWGELAPGLSGNDS